MRSHERRHEASGWGQRPRDRELEQGDKETAEHWSILRGFGEFSAFRLRFNRMDANAYAAKTWAREEFGNVDGGDRRRRDRVIKMAAVAGAAPFGTVARTFQRAADRQGAYDLLESKKVPATALLASMAIACVERCGENKEVFVPIDGSSLTLVDRRLVKNFGAVGTYRNKARGLKVVTAIAVDPRGTPLGICAQKWWTRPVVRRKRGGSKYRPTDERESRFWVETIGSVHAAFVDSDVTPTCVIDREGDATEMLHALVSRRMNFIIRSSWDRRLATTPTTYLRGTLEKQPVIGRYQVDVPHAPHRSARKARMELRVARVTLDLAHDWRGRRENIDLFAVSAKEVAPPPGEKPLHWILLTNLPVLSAKDAKMVVTGYTFRWRIEEFHKAWKSGTCNVETMQLRTSEAASTWATLLAAVAIRAERLKYLARNDPEAPAGIELTPTEIEATILLKRRQKKRTESVPDGEPTIAQAVLWIAELGSFAGKRGEQPGAITIARGLEKVRTAAEIIEQLRASGQIR